MAAQRRAFYLAAVFNLKLTGNFGRGIGVGNEVLLTNDPAPIRDDLTPEFWAAAGGVEMTALSKSGHAFYRRTRDDEVPQATEAIAALNDFLRSIRMFLNCLWLIRDNAANVELGFLMINGAEGRHAHSNALASWFSDSSGSRTAIEVSQDEIVAARGLVEIISAGGTSSPSDPDFYNVPLARFSRAFYFAQAARTANDLGLRISNSASAFEALFSTDTQESTHKVAERVAFFAGKSPQERKEIFRAFKKMYGIRSKVVHGSTKRTDREVLVEHARWTDDLLRRVLLTIMSSAEYRERFFTDTGSEAFESFCVDLVFGR